MMDNYLPNRNAFALCFMDASTLIATGIIFYIHMAGFLNNKETLECILYNKIHCVTPLCLVNNIRWALLLFDI